MSYRTAFLAASLAAAFAMANDAAASIVVGGRTYTPVDWTALSGNTYSGAAGAIGVTFETLRVGDRGIYDGVGDPGPGDYATDAPAFGGVTFVGSSILEAVDFYGDDPAGEVRLSFSKSVDSVLMIIGYPGVSTNIEQFGFSSWDFSDGLTMSVLSSENNAFVIAPGNNVLTNPLSGPDAQYSGVVQIDGGFSSIVWSQSNNAVDRLAITFAVATAPIPEPTSLTVFGGMAAALASVLGRRRRS